MTEPVNSARLAAAIGLEAGRQLDEGLARVRHCLEQLTVEQVWWRGSEPQNSIGNLILHLCGNVRQWILSGLGGAEDVRDRPAEFAERMPIPRAELLTRLETTVRQAIAVLGRVTPAQLVEPRYIQEFKETGLGAIFASVAHFRGHVQEIIHMTRATLKDRYRMFWEPKKP